MGAKLKQLRVQQLSKLWDVNFFLLLSGDGSAGSGRSRNVAKEGILTKTDRHNTSRPVTFLLFNDAIAYGDREWLTGAPRLRCLLPLRGCTLIDNFRACEFCSLLTPDVVVLLLLDPSLFVVVQLASDAVCARTLFQIRRTSRMALSWPTFPRSSCRTRRRPRWRRSSTTWTSASSRATRS